MPCYKLGLRFELDDMVKRFLASGRTGYYFAVVRESEVAAGDEMIRTAQDSNRLTVSEITRLYVTKRFDPDDISLAHRALQVAALPERWKEYSDGAWQNIPS